MNATRYHMDLNFFHAKDLGEISLESPRRNWQAAEDLRKNE